MIQLILQEEVLLKYLYNPATNEFESLTPTLRERFSLGSKDPSPKTKTDGEVAGALMDSFPQQSFLQYQNAVDDGFQGTFEEFLQINSLDKSELDMKDIEGQTAFAGVLKNLLKTSDDVSEQIAKTKTSKRGPEFNVLKKKDPKNYTEAEKLFEQDLTEKFQAIANDPLYKDLIPKKFKNIKSITELDSSDLNKISKDFTNFQFKSITDEKGLGPYTTLKKGPQSSVRSLYKAREGAKKRPDFFSLNIAGDTFNLPYMKGVDPKTVKNFEKVYPILKKIESNPTVKNYYKQIGGGKKGERILLNDIQAYLTGVDTRSRSVFESSKQIQFLKSLDLENKLSEETIELLKTQKGKKAANIFKQAEATKKATKVNLEQVNTESIQRINEIYSADPDATAKEVIDQYYGTSLKNKSKEEQAQMLKELRNDVITYYKIGAKTRKSVKGVRLPSKEKVDNILTSIMESKGKDSFDIYGGYLRNIYSDIADSVTKPNFSYHAKTSALSKKFKGQNVDHTVGLSAVHEVAPGYVEAVQIIPKAINKKKGFSLDKSATGIINDFFTNTPNKLRKIGNKEYKTFEEKVDAFNTLSKQFADANGVDTPLLRFGEPGKGPSPKETVEYFSEFSEGARKNMMEVWNNHGFVVYTKSRPMQSPYWKTLKDDIVSKRQIKNMGGLISRVNFSNGSKIEQFTNTLEEGPDLTFDQIKAALENTDLIKNLEEENKQTLKEQIYGNDGDRTLMQTFNTMFLDPKAYPYYAQEITSGGANILELAGRFPFAVTGLVSDIFTGRGGKLERAVETLDPKATKAIKEKIGFTDMLEESREKATGPQRTTGGILELAAEIPGPATPYFLLKAFPKIVKQIKNLVGTDAAARKVNEEIEKRLATDTVNQTRRDILLAAGAGGAVAVLKFLGLDNLVKTTKAIKAAPEIVTKGGTPKYFFDFVSLIKSKGDDISDTAATVERQKVYEYNGYTMYEQLDNGKIEIRKDTEGGAQYTTPDGETDTYETLIKEQIEYKPPETIIGRDGKPVKVPDDYEEVTVGRSEDPELGLDSIDEILKLLSKDGKSYSLKELEEMGLNTEALKVGDYKFKPEKAEGGIIAGVSSGPPPKSGPTPHGLPYVAKNVRPITERK